MNRVNISDKDLEVTRWLLEHVNPNSIERYAVISPVVINLIDTIKQLRATVKRLEKERDYFILSLPACEHGKTDKETLEYWHDAINGDEL